MATAGGEMDASAASTAASVSASNAEVAASSEAAAGEEGIGGVSEGLGGMLGPIGLAGMNARRGEVQAARSAEAVGVPFCLSTVSACSLREVRAGVTKPIWFQLYMIRDRAFMVDLLEQAKMAGCTHLFVCSNDFLNSKS